MRIIQVYQRPQLINNLKHGLTFATDKEINQKLLTRFRLFTFLTPCDPDNEAILQSIIDEWSDYFNEYYRVYSLRKDKNYEPLTNYHKWEKLRNNHSDTSDTNIDKVTGRSKNYNSGYDSNEDTLTSRIETENDPAHSKNVASGSDSDDNEVWGNIGVTTSQQMLQEELDLIRDIEDMYISKFAEAFNLDMEVDFYGRYL